MLSRIVAYEVDGHIISSRQGRSGTHTPGELYSGIGTDLPARFDQGTGDVLRDHTVFIFPVLDGRSGDGGLQVAAVMVFGVPGAGRLVKTAQPDHRIGDHLVADLEALEIVFLGGDEVFAED